MVAQNLCMPNNHDCYHNLDNYFLRHETTRVAVLAQIPLLRMRCWIGFLVLVLMFQVVLLMFQILILILGLGLVLGLVLILILGLGLVLGLVLVLVLVLGLVSD